jgi:glycosyltransferase involved in cell wall biosynthesis
MRQHHAEFDIAVAHGLWQYGTLGLQRALHGTEVPYVVFPHGMLDPWFKTNYPLKHLKKAVYWQLAEHRVLRDAQAVCFTCDEERHLARESFRPYRIQEKVVAFGTAWPEGDAVQQQELFLEAFPELRAKRVLLFLSRIHEKKGCDLLIEAFAREFRDRPEWQLVIAGPDQTGWQATLIRQSERLGISDRISWPGMLRGDMKWGAFRTAEAFVLPSHQENFGIVVAEALACGTPVLISNKVNIWREIEADKCGFVAPDTIEGTTDLFRRWASTTEEEKQTMGVNSQSCFANRFEIHEAARSLLEVLAACISETAAPTQSKKVPAELFQPDRE